MLPLIVGCASRGELDISESGAGVTAVRTPCPTVGVPAGTGDLTTFDPATSREATAIDVVAGGDAWFGRLGRGWSLTVRDTAADDDLRAAAAAAGMPMVTESPEMVLAERPTGGDPPHDVAWGRCPRHGAGGSATS